jgi:hypothetical protein
MNSKYICTVIATTLAATFGHNANAMLDSHATLNFSTSTYTCPLGTTGIPPNCYNSYGSSSYAVVVSTGSYFGIDLQGNNTLSQYERTGITVNEGIHLGADQHAYGSHYGYPNGTETPSIDMPFVFLGASGMHQTTSPITILSDDGAGHVTLNFSGWGITWNGSNSTLGTSPSGGPGIASITCGTDCSNGDTFTLDYASRLALADPSGLGGCYYAIHLVGTVSSVPLPAAFWLFGSGLIGVFGIAKRRNV